MSPASSGSSGNLTTGAMPDTPSFGSVAQWIAEPVRGTGGDCLGGDERPFDPRRYWDIYGGTD